MRERRIEGFLSKKEIQSIHESSLEVLSGTGVKITHPEIRSLLLEAGAKEGNDFALLFPPDLIEASLKKAPRSIDFMDLKGNRVKVKPGAPPLFWTGNAMFYLRGPERRELTRELYTEFCRVADHLPHLHAIVGTNLSDYPPSARDFVGFRAMAEYTQKHLRPVIFTPKGIEVILEMADVLLNGKSLKNHPIFSLGFTCVSPLRWSDSALEVFRVSSGYGIPLMINSEVISGATGPVTLAGSLVLANAEALSGVVIAQLLEPGRPVVFNLGFSHTFDMKVAETLTGAPEGGLLGAAGSAIAHFHHLPSASWMNTESKIPDAQAAYEKTLLGLLHGLGGVNLIWGIGNLESTLSLCPEQAIMDNEIAAGILRAFKGIEMDEERMALPLIKEMGQKGDYLSSEHTLRHFKNELRLTDLLSRERWTVWETAGKKELLEVAKERVKMLLNNPPIEHLSGSQREKLERIEKKGLERIT
ncbi:MAG: trimethylamine methyltransferase family protein [Deltaproteobacteria bacterium]|nr:trimethylamine methyltransferase family protein [Deltaproteobacteria bacterium]